MIPLCAPPEHHGPPDYQLYAHNLYMSAEDLHAYMLDVENLKKQHPLLTDVKELAADELGGHSMSKLYEFTDQGSCCWFPLRTVYHGRVSAQGVLHSATQTSSECSCALAHSPFSIVWPPGYFQIL